MRLCARTVIRVLSIALVALAPTIAFAIPTIRLTPSRSVLLSDGRDSTQICTEVRDTSGRLVPDGTTVNFNTSLGAFQRAGTSASATTQAGTARVLLTSPTKGTAVVTAASAGGGFERIEITFTDDPTETFEGNSYAVVTGDSSLIYGPGAKQIEAVGKEREDPAKETAGARVRYRNLEISADNLAVDCTATTVRAQGNVMLRRGTVTVRCVRLYYPLTSGNGYAIAQVKGHWRPVAISGLRLAVTVRSEAVPDQFLAMPSLADERQLITAKQILLFPGDKLQFKRPRFYQDRQALVSLPFYSLSLYAKQLFSDHVVTVGTQGVGLNIPVYYDMSPSTTGLLRLRNGERYGTSISATRPGVALDITQSYNSLSGGKRYTGEFGFTDVNRNDWGVRLSHSQEFSSTSRGTFTLETPQHQSLLSTGNLQQQFSGFNVGLNMYSSRSLRGISSSMSEADAYVETTPRSLGATGYRYALGATASSTHIGAQSYSNTTASQGVHVRMFNRPVHLDSVTTLSHTWSIGQAWADGGRGGVTMLSSLTASRMIGAAGNVQLSYDFMRLPGSYVDSGQHRLSSTLYLGAGTKASMFIYGSTLLDAPYRSLSGEARYNFARRWHLGVSANVQEMSSVDYQDYEFSVTRSIGLRELSITFSTLSHRFYFDMQAARF
jgi:hypothetical protein